MKIDSLLLDGEGYVRLSLGEAVIQLTAKETVALAASLLQASEAAITDSFIYQWAKERLRADDRTAGYLVGEFRNHRARERREAESPTPTGTQNEHAT